MNLECYEKKLNQNNSRASVCDLHMKIYQKKKSIEGDEGKGENLSINLIVEIPVRSNDIGQCNDKSNPMELSILSSKKKKKIDH